MVFTLKEIRKVYKFQVIFVRRCIYTSLHMTLIVVFSSMIFIAALLLESFLKILVLIFFEGMFVFVIKANEFKAVLRKCIST